ncbi:MAG TPA: amidase [Candidatus Binataceae bacterium]|nr:amidase [Candidatus Binataceae bacterium]
MPTELTALTMREAARLVRERAVSPVELTRACIDRIRGHDAELRAFITVLEEPALEQARRAEEAVMRKDALGPLHGVPLALKDCFAVRGVRTTGGSRLLAENIADRDCTVVERLRNAGGVFLGTLNMHEFALGSTTANPHYGIARNPWKRDRIPGGSSGGSAIAIAASMCLGSMGTDAGGSVRLPAALCGIVGLKPTYGRISRHGTLPLSLSLDHSGPMTRSVADAALMLQIVAGPDRRDATCSGHPVSNYLEAIEGKIEGLKVGLPTEYLADAMDDEVRDAFLKALDVLQSLGAVTQEVSLPHSRLGPPAMVAIMLSEASALHGADLQTRPEQYSDGMRTLLYAGSLIPARRYVQAGRARTMIIGDQLAALKSADVLVLPTVAIPAPPVGDTLAAVGNRRVNVDAALPRLTLPFNLSGLPAISIPCGFTSEGLPIGLQIVGRAFAEATVLNVAHAYEQSTRWHERRPPL